MKHVLFICSQNLLRSPTAEQVFSSWPGIEVASAGTNRDAVNPLTPELVAWAHVIFVMERAHREKLAARYSAHLKEQRITCLGIPDQYELMDPTLVKLLRTRVTPHL